MRYLLLVCILLMGLSANASQFSLGDVPRGDKIYASTPVTVGNGDTTLLSITNNDGILWGINLIFQDPGVATRQYITNVKVTIDGASERTLPGNIAHVYFSGTSADQFQRFVYLPYPMIRFNSSLTIKAKRFIQTGIGATTQGNVLYSLY